MTGRLGCDCGGRSGTRETWMMCGALALLLGCGPPAVPAPEPGLEPYQSLLWQDVAGVRVNLGGGNLILERTDLSIDTDLGEWLLAATYNSANSDWHWNFEMNLVEGVFIDDTGAEYSTEALTPGEEIPGSHWLHVGSDAVKTLGGRVYEFASDGALETVRWSSGAYPRLEYVKGQVNGESRIVQVRQCSDAASCGLLFVFFYDAEGLLESCRDRAGRMTAYSYDAAGRLTTARDGLDLAQGSAGFRYEYGVEGSGAGRIVVITNSEGERVDVEYERGRVSKVIPKPGVGSPWEFAFEAFFLVNEARVRNPLGGERVVLFDPDRRALEVTNEYGEATRYGWSGRRLIEQILPSGVKTEWFHPSSDVTVVLEPSGNAVQSTYALDAENRGNPFARAISSISDSLGIVETRTYDAAGRLVSVANGEAEATTFVLDSLGRVEAVVDPAGVMTSYWGFGPHGHPTSRLRGLLTEHFEYDLVGNMTRGASGDTPISSGRPGIVRREFDADRNLTRLVMDDGSSSADITLSYRSDSAPTAIRRPYGGDTEFDHDSHGRLVARRDRVNGAWKTTSVEYDGLDLVVAAHQANGTSQELVRGLDGRILEMRSYRDGVEEHRLALTYQASRVVGKHGSVYGVEETLAYDGAGRLAAQQFPGGERQQLSYDVRSRIDGRLLFDESDALIADIEFESDLANRRIKMVVDGVVELEDTWVDGRREHSRYGNGIERVTTYDDVLGGFPQRIVMTHSERGPIATTEFGLDAVGIEADLASETQSYGSTYAWTSETYRMKPVGELAHAGPKLEASTLVHSESGGASQQIARSHRYDHLQNWGFDPSTDPGVQWSFNPERNRLLATPAHTYTYDEAGFVTNRDGVDLRWTATGQIASIGPAAFEWDLEGRPVWASDGVGVVEYRFGGIVAAAPAGAPILLDLEDVQIQLGSAARKYRHRDFRGNVKLVTDETADVILHHGYTGYSTEVTYGSGSDDRGFAGGTMLDDQLYLLGLRIYDGAAGRFLSPDPIFGVVGQHMYAEGNPIWLWDPGGLQATPVDVAVFSSMIIASGGASATTTGVVAVMTGTASLTVMAPVIGLGIIFILLGLALYVSTRGECSCGSAANYSFDSGAMTAQAGAPALNDVTVTGAVCSPEAATAMPEAPWLLLGLVPLQGMLLALLFRAELVSGLRVVARRVAPRRLPSRGEWRGPGR